MNDSFLSRDSSDKKQKRLFWIYTVALEPLSRRHMATFFEIDSIVDDMDAFWIDIEQTLYVRFGFIRNGYDRVGHFERGLLDPERKIITAGELFTLPRSQRLERVCGNDERNSVILFRENS